jgi:DNA-binding NtrC family response regulator
MESANLRILAVDDQPEGLLTLETILLKEGFSVLTASDGEAALAVAQEQQPALILLDVNMPKLSGLEVTEALKSDPFLRYIPVVLLTANSELTDVLAGFEHGANDYIQKPYKKAELIARVRAALRTKEIYEDLRRSRDENSRLQAQVESRSSFQNIIGTSAPMQRVFGLIEKVQEVNVPVLITGESGTGKELVARAIHYHGVRRRKPFVVLNCSAFNENLLESELFGHMRGSFTGAVRDKQGLLEAADGGSVFLDELGEMSLALQVKLLRVLQDGTYMPVGATAQKKVDVRIIAATNRNLRTMIADGTFREDLFYRLNVVNIELPPLRERRADIPMLIDYFLVQSKNKLGRSAVRFAPSTITALTAYDWPGNIRELENEVLRALVLCDADPAAVEVTGRTPEVGPEFLSEHVALRRPNATSPSEQAEAASGASHRADTDLSLKSATLRLERQLMEQALRRSAGNKSEAARMLEVSRSYLISKAKEYGLE